MERTCVKPEVLVTLYDENKKGIDIHFIEELIYSVKTKCSVSQ